MIPKSLQYQPERSQSNSQVTLEMEGEQERLFQASLSRQLVPGKDHKK